jgi:glutamate/tyrosine decarboxylase-like PLP-dependent enzyme
MNILESSRAAFQTALDGALNYVENLDGGPVTPALDRLALRNRLAKRLSDEGMSPSRVIEELIADCAGGMLGSASGRFFGWAIGGALPAAIAADWLVSTWDQNAVLYSSAPAAAVVEEVVGSWLKRVIKSTGTRNGRVGRVAFRPTLRCGSSGAMASRTSSTGVAVTRRRWCRKSGGCREWRF